MFKLIVAIIFCIMAVNIANAECNYKNKKMAYFSSDAKKDKFIVETTGKTCSNAHISIRIVNSKDKVLYEFKDKDTLYDENKEEILYYTTSGKKINIEDLIIKNIPDTIAFILREEAFSYTSNLPKWQPIKDFYKNNLENIYVSEDFYRMLGQKKWHTFTHPVGYEDDRLIVYDQSQGSVVIVSGRSPKKTSKGTP
jgi:hypothetical protein